MTSYLGLIIEIIGQKYKRCKYAPLHIVRLTRWCSTNQISNPGDVQIKFLMMKLNWTNSNCLVNLPRYYNIVDCIPYAALSSLWLVYLFYNEGLCLIFPFTCFTHHSYF